jgi:hypothetical protein
LFGFIAGLTASGRFATFPTVVSRPSAHCTSRQRVINLAQPRIASTGLRIGDCSLGGNQPTASGCVAASADLRPPADENGGEAANVW